MQVSLPQICPRINTSLFIVYELKTRFEVDYTQGGEAVYYSEFGDILRKLRTTRNLTQKELGAYVNLSKAVVSKYENGLGYPTYDVLIRIASFFGVTTDYLLGVPERKMLDVSDLSDSQIAAIHHIIDEFKQSGKE